MMMTKTNFSILNSKTQTGVKFLRRIKNKIHQIFPKIEIGTSKCKVSIVYIQ